MINPSRVFQNGQTYSITDINVEILRQMNRQKFMSEHLGGLFPGGLGLSDVWTVLDVACGPGGWVLDVAAAYRDMQIVGIDSRPAMAQYARTQAIGQRRDNAHFVTGSIYQMALFADDAFDLVNARLLAELVPLEAWLKLLQELYRVCRPGGILCWIEGSFPSTNSRLYKQWFEMVSRATGLARRVCNITSIMDVLVERVGYVEIEKAGYTIDFSAGMPAHHCMYRDFDVTSSHLLQLLVEAGTEEAEKMELLRQQVLTDMLVDDFCALWPLTVLRCMKPASEWSRGTRANAVSSLARSTRFCLDLHGPQGGYRATAIGS